MSKRKPTIAVIYIAILIVFIAFLAVPLGILFIRSFETSDGFSLSNYFAVLSDNELVESIINSIKISSSAFVNIVVAFSSSPSLSMRIHVNHLLTRYACSPVDNESELNSVSSSTGESWV